MAEQDKRDERSEPEGENQTGDPGRTPGTAEGDEQTVDEDLRNKERSGQK